MENAVDALKIAFAIFVLILAISVSIASFNMVKAASDVILYSRDKTNFYEYKGAYGKASENRIVGLETVIPTLYRYYKENYTVVFQEGYGYSYETGEFDRVQYMPVYKNNSSTVDRWTTGAANTDEKIKNQKQAYTNLMTQKYNKFKIDSEYKIDNTNIKNIFSFDLDEEILRQEPWTGSTDKIKSNLDAFLNGSTYINPVDNSEYKNYSKDSFLTKGGFIEKFKDAKFVEKIGIYNYSANNATDGVLASLTKEKEKRVIIFTLIKSIR